MKNWSDSCKPRSENPTFPTILRIGEDMNTITIEGKAVGLCRGGVIIIRNCEISEKESVVLEFL